MGQEENTVPAGPRHDSASASGPALLVSYLPVQRARGARARRDLLLLHGAREGEKWRLYRSLARPGYVIAQREKKHLLKRHAWQPQNDIKARS